MDWQVGQEKSPRQMYGYMCQNFMDRKEDLSFKEVMHHIYLKERDRSIHDAFGDDPTCKKLGELYLAFLLDTTFDTNQKIVPQFEKKVAGNAK